MKFNKNRLVSLMLFSVGVISIIREKDLTFMIFAALIAVPLFFAKKNYIV